MALPKRVQERLQNHPEAIEVDLFEEGQKFLLNILSAKRLRAEGIEVVPILLTFVNRIGGVFYSGRYDDVELGSPEAMDMLREVVQNEDLENLAILTYWGLKTFDEELTLEEVEACLTLGAVIRLFPKLMKAFTSFAQDTQPEDLIDQNGAAAEEDSEGN